jgi:hypothetical protein
MRWDYSLFSALRKYTILLDTDVDTNFGNLFDAARSSKSAYEQKKITNEELMLIYSRGFRHAIEIMRIQVHDEKENSNKKLEQVLGSMIETCDNVERYSDYEEEKKIELLNQRKKDSKFLINFIHKSK